MSEKPRDPSDDPGIEHIEERLDEALEESFPASDPPAVSLSDDPPKAPRLVEDAREIEAEVAPRKVTIFKRVLAGGALAAAGVVVTRMFLRRMPKRRVH